MIHIKYKLDRSPFHGIGLFADESIVKGTLIYTASPLLDVNITQEQFDSLSEKEQKEIRWWGFLDPVSNKWHVDFDVTHFINHADDAAVTQDTVHNDAYLIAARDIKAGEELTQNYLEFESEEDLRKRGIVPAQIS
ncbi:hypothetical protein A2765_05645 [Candidatus Kaiserbacteria bacterium RIFCSPHIGHO2_01_FULL_56_24]|uniref:SET domain-containing protein n=1 Tax=Candidatus Kaiserbacteria bacterium RIFCSPHIGHO2_01_FULL_56_24 TaxID=1798487 RepID=A0A1F6DBJ3_9BACT|nr:MAG: hypothetical protein A2765_05645 [Candidatus Kaiserbacteria bacterium RIFCSPHIGHO2_01_FULL_56_24]